MKPSTGSLGKPRVLVIGPVFPQGGGVGTVDYTLLHCDLSRDFDMRVLDTGRGKSGEGREGRLVPINMYYYLRQMLRLVAIMIFARPQILHQSLTDSVAFWKETSFMVIGRVFRVKVVAHVHGNRLEVQYRRRARPVQWLMRRALGVPHVLLTLSEHWRAFLAEVAPRGVRLAVVPNCVDPNVAEAMEREVDGAGSEDGLVLFMGGVGTRKGVPDALRAASLVRRQIPAAHFVFAGPPAAGEELAAVERARQETQIDGTASFPGLVVGAQKIGLLKRASIFILPSYHENFPVAILEAMAMGLPVVATNVAGIPDVVEHGRNGFLIQPGDHQALAERIVQLAQDAELRRTMGRANVAKVWSQYHPRLFAQRIHDLYWEILS